MGHRNAGKSRLECTPQFADFHCSSLLCVCVCVCVCVLGTPGLNSTGWGGDTVKVRTEQSAEGCLWTLCPDLGSQIGAAQVKVGVCRLQVHRGISPQGSPPHSDSITLPCHTLQRLPPGRHHTCNAGPTPPAWAHSLLQVPSLQHRGSAGSPTQELAGREGREASMEDSLDHGCFQKPLEGPGRGRSLVMQLSQGPKGGGIS
jgi:hypothetical protein